MIRVFMAFGSVLSACTMAYDSRRLTSLESNPPIERGC